jgi:hypothetical protein
LQPGCQALLIAACHRERYGSNNREWEGVDQVRPCLLRRRGGGPRRPAVGEGGGPTDPRLSSEWGGGSHQHLLLLPGESSQWRAVNVRNHLLYGVGDAVLMGSRYDIGAIERALAADLLGGQVNALIHHSDIRWAIEPQVAKMDGCLIWSRIRLRRGGHQGRSDQNEASGNRPQHRFCLQ